MKIPHAGEESGVCQCHFVNERENYQKTETIRFAFQNISFRMPKPMLLLCKMICLGMQEYSYYF